MWIEMTDESKLNNRAHPRARLVKQSHQNGSESHSKSWPVSGSHVVLPYFMSLNRIRTSVLLLNGPIDMKSRFLSQSVPSPCHCSSGPQSIQVIYGHLKGKGRGPRLCSLPLLLRGHKQPLFSLPLSQGCQNLIDVIWHTWKMIQQTLVKITIIK